jgi:pilus assembly protein Flp/PilA
MAIIRKSQNLLGDFISDESGLSAVEYGLLAAGIAIGLWGTLQGIGGDLQTIFGDVKGNLDSAQPAAH